MSWFPMFQALINAILTGLSKGCTSTEADVWLYNGTLYVCPVDPFSFGTFVLRLIAPGRA